MNPALADGPSENKGSAKTLRQAWALCRLLLLASAQVLLNGRGKTAVEFGDGVLTERGTFQKYFEQAELRAYLETQLQTAAIPAGIGTFYIFKDEARRQQFLANRFRRREILPAEGRETRGAGREKLKQTLEPLMEVIAAPGRLPDPAEFAGTEAVRERFGSLKRARHPADHQKIKREIRIRNRFEIQQLNASAREIEDR